MNKRMESTGLGSMVGRWGSACMVALVALGAFGCSDDQEVTIFIDASDDTDASDLQADASPEGSVNDTGPTETGTETGSVTCEGDKRCNGSTLEQACTDGTWQKVEDCAGEKPACNPVTLACEKVFETVWQVEDSDKTVTLPYFDDGTGSAKCDFQVLWGDEESAGDFSKATKVTDCADVAKRKHTYAEAGEKTIKILGTYNGWGTNAAACDDCGTCPLTKLKKIGSFGPVGLTARAFACTDGVELTDGDKPDPEKWTNAKGMFQKAKNISEKISLWDTSKVTDMEEMFQGAENFNQPIGSWDTQNVTDMSFMFYKATAFDQPIGEWKTGNVKNMHSMFEDASKFNQEIGSWDTSSVTDMHSMFEGASSFDQPIGEWKTNKVKKMASMFKEAAAFDQNLKAWTLDESVELDQIFKGSGLTKDNFCSLMEKEVWKNNKGKLGKSFECGSGG